MFYHRLPSDCALAKESLFPNFSKFLFALAIMAPPAALAQSNFRSGISMNLSGTEGVDYAVETHFHDPKIYDGEVVYIKDQTQISFTHNERNVYGKTQFLGYYVTTGGNNGQIRYWVDGDLNWSLYWGIYPGDPASVTGLGPAYSTPLKFASLSYPAPSPQQGESVLGATGGNGAPYIPKTGYWHYGNLDSVGDEWHTLTVWDDDSVAGLRPGDSEWWASDPKVRLFVVNPKTPCLVWDSSGDGKFYTTPAKNYFIPKIFDQTTYLESTSGSVSCKIVDINGNNIRYRIVTNPSDTQTPYGDGGSNQVTLAASDFAIGTQYLQYYYEGNSAYKKTRVVVRNPSHPSAGEEHGLMLWENAAAKADWVADVVITDTSWWDNYRTGKAASQSTWDRYRNTGERYTPNGALPHALLTDQLGTEASHGSRPPYAVYAKEMLMQNMQRLDPVGAQTRHPVSINPCRELFYRGYFDSDHVFDLAFGYDVLIAVYKNTDHPDGITPVEDYYLRDIVARGAFNQVAAAANIYNTGEASDTGGMWDVARRCAAVACMFAIPSYDSPYYGKSGLNGSTGGYEWAPFKDDRYSWKELWIDNNRPLSIYPNYSKRLGIEEYNCAPDGQFIDRNVYFGHMGEDMTIAANLILRHLGQTGATKFPNLTRCVRNASNGVLVGKKGSDPPTRFTILTGLGQRFPSVAETQVPRVLAEPNGSPYSDGERTSSTNAPYVWGMFDEDFGSGEPVPVNRPRPPSGLRIDSE